MNSGRSLFDYSINIKMDDWISDIEDNIELDGQVLDQLQKLLNNDITVNNMDNKIENKVSSSPIDKIPSGEIPEPSQLSLSTITMTSNIDRLLNLGIVTKYLNLNAHLDGIKCEGIGSYGNIPIGKKKAHTKETNNEDKVADVDVLSLTDSLAPDEDQEVVQDPSINQNPSLNQDPSLNQNQEEAKNNKKSNKRPNKNRLKADFFNQCTVYVYPYGSDDVKKGVPFREKPLNIKLFNNGQMVLTGVKDDKEAHPAIQAIIDGLNLIQPGAISYKAFTNHEQEFNDKEFEKYIKLNIAALDSLLGYILTKCNYLDNLKMEVPIIPKKITKLQDLLDELIKKNNMKHKSKKTEFVGTGIGKTPPIPIIPLWNAVVDAELMILIKIYQICLMYVTPTDLLGIGNSIDNSNNINNWLHSQFVVPVLDPIITNFNEQDCTIKVVLPAFIRKDSNDNIVYKINNTRIDMINSFFYANFEINRVNIQQLLVNKYKISADYKPDVYQGVNAKVVSRAICKESVHQICQCKKRHCGCACTCCEISVFIFRKGTIIITGAKAWAQVIDVSQQIQKILITEYPGISLRPIVKKVKIETLPDKVIVDGSVWLRKSYIKNNPKNYFLIKEFKLTI